MGGRHQGQFPRICCQRRLGRNAEDFKNRYVFLRALLDNLHKNNVEPFYLDMRANNDIVIRPKKLSQTNSENRGLTTGG